MNNVSACSDTPLSLATSALQSIPILAGVQRTGFDFSIYTGDLISHDLSKELSRDYVEYTEVSQVKNLELYVMVTKQLRRYRRTSSSA